MLYDFRKDLHNSHIHHGNNIMTEDAFYVVCRSVVSLLGSTDGWPPFGEVIVNFEPGYAKP